MSDLKKKIIKQIRETGSYTTNGYTPEALENIKKHRERFQLEKQLYKTKGFMKRMKLKLKIATCDIRRKYRKNPTIWGVTKIIFEQLFLLPFRIINLSFLKKIPVLRGLLIFLFGLPGLITLIVLFSNGIIPIGLFIGLLILSSFYLSLSIHYYAKMSPGERGTSGVARNAVLIMAIHNLR